ncbi:hypothetical protein PINS_up001652 [Pythium insidiosum]|nr:hypothetical protein PINS_up001652 [Pythium insidiosum]
MGAVISRELEQDDVHGVNGVVSETLPSRVASLYRRGAADVAQREQVFQFCKEWDLSRLTDLLRWHERIAAQDSGAATIDLRALHHQLDELETALSARRALLDDVESELEELPPVEREHETENSDLLALHRATLESRRDELIKEIATQQEEVAARRVHLLATLDGVNLERHVRWRNYLAAMERVQFHSTLVEHHEAHAAAHPATIGYAMTRDPSATKALEEMQRGDTLLPPPERHEIDGHTDDSASSSAASEEADGDGDEEEDGGDEHDHDTGAADADADANAVEKVVAMEGTPSKAQEEKGEEEEEEDEDDEDDEKEANVSSPQPAPTETTATVAETDSATTTTSLLTTEALTKHEKSLADPKAAFLAQLKRPRVIRQPVPELFDPTLRSPVFFGSTLTKRSDELIETTSKDHALETKENDIFEHKLHQQRALLESTLKSERSKLESVEQRQAEMLAKRERYWEKRQVEFERAKKELDPSDIFFRNARRAGQEDTRDARVRGRRSASRESQHRDENGDRAARVRRVRRQDPLCTVNGSAAGRPATALP